MWCSDNTWKTVSSLVSLMLPACNHMKLVRRGDNSNKKTLMYIPYISCNRTLSGTFTCKFEKGLKWGYHPSTDWMRQFREKFHQRSGDPDLWVKEISAAELGLRVGKIPAASRVHSCFWVGKIPSMEPWPLKGPEVGVSLINRLNASTPSGKNPSSRVVIWHGPDREKLPGVHLPAGQMWGAVA